MCLVYGILVVDGGVVAGGVVDRYLCLELQAGNQMVETDFDSGVEVEMTAGKLVVACGVHGGERIVLFELSTADEVFAVNQVSGGVDQRHRSLVVGVDCVDGNQRREWRSTGSGRAHVGRTAPEVGEVAASVVECRAGVDPTSNPVVHGQVDVAADVQTGGMVLLPFAEVHQVVGVVKTHVGIEFGEPSASVELSRTLIAFIMLLKIFVGKEVEAGITVGVGSRRCHIYLFVGECRFESVVGAGLIVESHILGTGEIFGIAFRYVKSGIAADTDVQTVVRSSLGGDEYRALRGTASVEHHSLGTLEEGYLTDFGGCDVVGGTFNSINQGYASSHVPKVACGDRHHVGERVGGVTFFE